MAQILTAQEQPNALDLWSAYEETAQGDPQVEYQALVGKAQIKLGADEAKEAQELYQKASALPVESSQQSWARLGQVQALIEQQKYESALNILAFEHQQEDQEIMIQSYILEAQLYLRKEDPAQALKSLDQTQAQALGPAWDATLEETRVSIYTNLKEEEKAIQTLLALAERWPLEEEALLPAYLGLADIYRGRAQMEEARSYAKKALQNASDENYIAQAQSLLSSL